MLALIFFFFLKNSKCFHQDNQESHKNEEALGDKGSEPLRNIL